MPPFEDAAMLMRYSQNFVYGHGIVWNIGEHPVDGATDFLFMICVAITAKTGLSIENSVLLIDMSSHILTGIIIYIFIRKFLFAGRWMAFTSLLFFILGTGLIYTAVFFGTPFFALFSAITWFCANEAVIDPKYSNSLIFSVSGLILGLIRPEGVFLAIFMLIAILFKIGFKKSKKIVLSFLIIFGIIGSIYFIWRWGYFGYPLPNPYYKKGGFTLHLRGLTQSIGTFVIFSYPFIPAFILGGRSKENLQQTIFSLIPVIGFIL